MAIDWSEDYATSIDSIDRQHRKLFQYINKLEACINRNIFSGNEIDEITEFLGTYTKMHFSHEEFCMNERKCPVSEKNKKAHDSFLEYYFNFIENYERTISEIEKETQIRKLQKMAEDWLVQHICNIDVHLKNCVKP